MLPALQGLLAARDGWQTGRAETQARVQACSLQAWALAILSLAADLARAAAPAGAPTPAGTAAAPAALPPSARPAPAPALSAAA